MRKYTSRIFVAALALVNMLLCLGAAADIRQVGEPRLMPAQEHIVLRPLDGTPLPGEEKTLTVSHFDAQLIARTLYGEYRGPDKLQQAAVAWCILNRADHYGQSVEEVVTAPNQFMGYSANNPLDPELYAMAEDVLRRHAREKLGITDVGRVLPKEYMWFAGDGRINNFRDRYVSGNRWDWSLENPYVV